MLEPRSLMIPTTRFSPRFRRARGNCAKTAHGFFVGVASLLMASLLAIMQSSSGALAQTTSPANKDPLLITLGTNIVYAPKFEGSKTNDFSIWPIISWRNQSSKEWLDMPTDGLDYAVIETDKFRMGPVGYLRWQRNNPTIKLRGYQRIGMGKEQIDVSVEAGLFAEYWPVEWLRTRLELRETVVGANGLLAIAAMDFVWRPQPALTLSLGPRLTIGDERFMDSYYGITPGQSLVTGLSAYDPGAGIRSVGVAGLARYKLSEAWTTQAFFEYQHLASTASDSPVISVRGSPDQLLVGAGLSYTFRAPW